MGLAEPFEEVTVVLTFLEECLCLNCDIDITLVFCQYPILLTT